MFFERPETGSRVLLVHIESDSELASMEELVELAESAGLQPVGCIVSSRRMPHPATYVGRGKVDEITALIAIEPTDLVIFDAELSATQERNLESELGKAVLDRTGLILEIFAQRARTHEGKLQVELAQLEHASTRLVRGWTHLDRQRGGSGRGQGASAGLGGAGETQLEADQRMLGDRVRRIKQRLERVKKQRVQNRRGRHRSDIKTVSLAGYTNAGKSTLFNLICESSVFAADQLFATLDPTLRSLHVPIVGKVIVSDTVGFIRQLPHSLVQAFHATLEEVSSADLILHIVDAAAPHRQERLDEVNQVLNEIGAEEVPQLVVYNKIDACARPARLARNQDGKPVELWMSAQTGEGRDLLTQAISELLTENMVETCIVLQPHQGSLRAKLFELGEVIKENTSPEGEIRMNIRIEEKALQKLRVAY